MARVNIEDDIESRDEFWKLLEILKDRDLCLGKLVRWFRLAQRKYGKGIPVTQEEISATGLEIMIETGWAVRIPGGFQALGADTQFAWYIQKIEAGNKGGRPKKGKGEGEENQVDKKPDGLRNEPTKNPLAPTPTPAPSLALAPSQNTTTPEAGVAVASVAAWTPPQENWPFRDPDRTYEIVEVLNHNLSVASKTALSTVPFTAQARWLESFPDAAFIREQLPLCLAHLVERRPKSHFSTFGSFFGSWLDNRWKKRPVSVAAARGEDANKDPFEKLGIAWR